MRISWGRGFLRLWVVASLAWAAVVGVEMRPDALSLGFWLPSDPSGLAKLESDSSQARLELASMRRPNTEAFVAALQEADRRATDKTVAWFAWSVGFPSALALLLGLAVAWVVRGFVGQASRARRSPVFDQPTSRVHRRWLPPVRPPAS